MALALGLLSWHPLGRLVRAEFLTLREREFVDAARVAGASDARIIFKHILPNTVDVIVVNATLVMSGGILPEAALGYPRVRHPVPRRVTGVVDLPVPGAGFSPGSPICSSGPACSSSIIAMCLNFIGDGLRDAFDPRQKRIPKARDLRKSRETPPVHAAADLT